MCSGSARADVRDLHFSERLPVVALPQVMLAAAELDDADLGALAVADHGRDDLAALQEGLAQLHVGALTYEQHLTEFHGGARLGIELLDSEKAVFGDTILLSAGGDDCVHRVLGDWNGVLRRPRILLTQVPLVKRLFP